MNHTLMGSTETLVPLDNCSDSCSCLVMKLCPSHSSNFMDRNSRKVKFIYFFIYDNDAKPDLQSMKFPS